MLSVNGMTCVSYLIFHYIDKQIVALSWKLFHLDVYTRNVGMCNSNNDTCNLNLVVVKFGIYYIYLFVNECCGGHFEAMLVLSWVILEAILNHLEHIMGRFDISS